MSLRRVLSSDTSPTRARIVAEVQRQPDRQEDQTATWSLMLLRGALRKTELPHIAKETIRVVLHEAGYTFGKTRTWCPTGTAVRKRQAGVVTVQDPRGPEKNIDRASLRARGRGRTAAVVKGAKRDRIKLFPSREKTGTWKANRPCSPTSTCAGARPNC